MNILLDAEVSKLRDTMRKGIQDGQWDLKVGEKVYLKLDQGNVSLLESIEFSERVELYRRGILNPPEPRVVELSAQLMPSSESEKPVRIRWRATGALTVALYQDGILVPGEFRPLDEVEVRIQKATEFRLVADYGNGEHVTAEERVNLMTYPTGGSGPSPILGNGTTIFEVKPDTIEAEGTPNRSLEELRDRCADYKVKGIRVLQVSVDQVMDYRKLTTALPLLTHFSILIDQLVTIQTGSQFVRLEYQGDGKGFTSFLTPTNALLGSPSVQANVRLKLTFQFGSDVVPTGSDIDTIQQALGRNPVERINLRAEVVD